MILRHLKLRRNRKPYVHPKGIIITPEQAYHLRTQTTVEQWERDPAPIYGSIGLYWGVPIIERPLDAERIYGVELPDGYLDLRVETSI